MVNNIIIQFCPSIEYKFCPTRYLNLNKLLKNNEKYNNINNINIIYGINSINCKIIENYKNILIEFEEPNFFIYRDLNKYIEFTKNIELKLTLCPYTSQIFNNILNKEISKNIFFPTDIKYIQDILGIPNFDDKIFNVQYTGHNVSYETQKFINISDNIIPNDYLDKYKLLYNTKIVICHNVLFCAPNHISIYDTFIKYFPELKNDNKYIPQLKSRVFESGFSKCIPLVMYEHTKIIENYFIPDIDFIYFFNLDDLNDKIAELLKNYDKYKIIAENCYNKCINNYTIEHFIDKYILEQELKQ